MCIKTIDISWLWYLLIQSYCQVILENQFRNQGYNGKTFLDLLRVEKSFFMISYVVLRKKVQQVAKKNSVLYLVLHRCNTSLSFFLSLLLPPSPHSCCMHTPDSMCWVQGDVSVNYLFETTTKLFYKIHDGKTHTQSRTFLEPVIRCHFWEVLIYWKIKRLKIPKLPSLCVLCEVVTQFLICSSSLVSF